MFRLVGVLQADDAFADRHMNSGWRISGGEGDFKSTNEGRGVETRADHFLMCPVLSGKNGADSVAFRNYVASVLPIKPNLDSQRLPETPARSLKICYFIGEKADFRSITVLPKRDGAVEWIRTTTVLLPPAPQAGASASSATTALR